MLPGAGAGAGTARIAPHSRDLGSSTCSNAIPHLELSGQLGQLRAKLIYRDLRKPIFYLCCQMIAIIVTLHLASGPDDVSSSNF